MISVIIAPAPNRTVATGCWLMKPSTRARMMAACGEGRTARVSPATASPNWNALASSTMVSPAATEAAITPRNFTFSWAAGVEPSQ